MKQKISTTIITLNEEDNIRKCLESIKDFSDEIVVVDSGSKDKTVEIAKQYGAKTYLREFDTYANQKNYAAKKTTGNWIFSIDADELATKGLIGEINDAIEDDNYVAYSIPRRNIILGKFIRFTRWQPELDRHIWLWRRGKGSWVGDVHEEVVIKGRVGKLQHPKIHTQYDSVNEFLGMMNKYSELEAINKLKNGTSFSFLKLLLEPIYNFFVRYFYRLGMLDGWRGFILSYLMAVYHFQVWIKIWSIREQKNY